MKIKNYNTGTPDPNVKIIGSADDGTTYNYTIQSLLDLLGDIASPEYIISEASFNDFPPVGDEATIYVDESTYSTYMWDVASSQYVQVSTPPVTPSTMPDEGDLLFADVATTAVLKSCTYNNGTSGVGATLTGVAFGQVGEGSGNTIDGVTTYLNQVILVKNQAPASQNGLYVVTTLGNGSTQFVLTRIPEADTSAELYPLQVNIVGGVSNIGKYFIQNVKNPTIGTTNLGFVDRIASTKDTQISFIDTSTSLALPTCTYTSGSNANMSGYGATLTATANGTLGTINGVSIVNGTRILVKDQANTSHNGDYIVSNTGSATTPWVLTRLTWWGSGFNKYYREFKVNNVYSSDYGSRYVATSIGLTNANFGSVSITFTAAPTGAGIPAWLEFNGTDLTIWNNGKGNIASNTSYGQSALISNSTGVYNTSIGYSSLYSNTIGSYNTSIGGNSLRSNIGGSYNTALGSTALYANTTGEANTAIGRSSLSANTTGSYNTAIGNISLYSNTIGINNVGIGHASLYLNTSGNNNTAIGHSSLTDNTTGAENTGIGYSTLSDNTTGYYNTAVGCFSLRFNTTGESNVGVGHSSLKDNTTGSYNTGVGGSSLLSNTTGVGNVGLGSASLALNTVGSYNVAIGISALSQTTTAQQNVAIGSSTLSSVSSDTSFCVAIGYESLKNNTGDYNTAIGHQSLNENISGVNNTAIGNSALKKNLTDANTAVGYYSAYNTTTGTGNTSVGHSSLVQNTIGTYNVAIGLSALAANVSGGSNVAIGYGCEVGSSGSNNTVIGTTASSTNFSNSIVIGRAAAATANNQLVIGSSTSPVGSVDTIGTFTPSHKFKIKLNGTDYWIQLDQV